jgi:hypothetical protein
MKLADTTTTRKNADIGKSLKWDFSTITAQSPKIRKHRHARAQPLSPGEHLEQDHLSGFFQVSIFQFKE